MPCRRSGTYDKSGLERTQAERARGYLNDNGSVATGALLFKKTIIIRSATREMDIQQLFEPQAGERAEERPAAPFPSEGRDVAVTPRENEETERKSRKENHKEI